MRRARALAEFMRPFATELRLVEAVDLVWFARTEHFAALEELVASSSETIFKPGALRYAWGADVAVGWGEPPSVRLDMEFSHCGVTAFFGLVLSDRSAGLDLYGMMFDPPGDEEENTRRLMLALHDARATQGPDKAGRAF